MTFCKLKTLLSSNFVYNKIYKHFRDFVKCVLRVCCKFPSFSLPPYPLPLSTPAMQAITVPLFLSPPPKLPPPPKLFWHSCKMATRNAKRSISTILPKNRGLWTVYANREAHEKNPEETRLSETLTYVLATLQDIRTSFYALIRRRTIQNGL